MKTVLRVSRTAILIALFLGTAVLVGAATLTWNGGTGPWNVAGNWTSVPNTGAPPTAADDVFIPSGTCNIDGSRSCKTITVNGGALGVSGIGRNLIVNGMADFRLMTAYPAANLTLNMQNSTPAILYGPNNTGVHIIGLFVNCAGTTLSLSGTLTLSGVGVLTMNAGTFSLYNGVTPATLTLAANALNMATAATLDVGTGTLDGGTNGASITVNNAGATISQSTGTLSCTGLTVSAGSYTLSDAGVVTVGAGGITANGTGAITLNAAAVSTVGFNQTAGTPSTNAGSALITSSGSVAVTAGTFTAGSSTLTMTGNSTIQGLTTTNGFFNVTVASGANTVSMASALTMNGNLSVTNGTLATGNFGFTATGTLNVSGTLDLTGSTLSTAFPPPFQVAGVGTVSTGGTIVTGNNSIWFKSDLTLDGGTFNFSGATADSTTIDVDGTLSGTPAGAAASTWTNGAAGAGTIRPISANLTNFFSYVPGQTRFTFINTGNFTTVAGQSVASIRLGSVNRSLTASLTLNSDLVITGNVSSNGAISVGYSTIPSPSSLTTSHKVTISSVQALGGDVSLVGTAVSFTSTGSTFVFSATARPPHHRQFSWVCIQQYRNRIRNNNARG